MSFIFGDDGNERYVVLGSDFFGEFVLPDREESLGDLVLTAVIGLGAAFGLPLLDVMLPECAAPTGSGFCAHNRFLSLEVESCTLAGLV